MVDTGAIKEHMEIIGADGVRVGNVDKVVDNRIKLTKGDSGNGRHEGHHHYLSTGLVAAIEDGKVRLSANAANALMFEEEKDGSPLSATSDKAGYSSKPYRQPVPTKRKSASLNWSMVGVGAAAVSAVAGAALLARGSSRDADKFELRLQNDESIRLISSSKVEGTPVVGSNGEHLGKIENFMVDKYSGRVAYAVMSFGGTMGFGENLFPLPWSFLNYDVAKDGYVLHVTKARLASAPKFKPSEAPEFDTRYRQDVANFYGRSNG